MDEGGKGARAEGARSMSKVCRLRSASRTGGRQKPGVGRVWVVGGREGGSRLDGQGKERPKGRQQLGNSEQGEPLRL